MAHWGRSSSGMLLASTLYSQSTHSRFTLDAGYNGPRRPLGRDLKRLDFDLSNPNPISVCPPSSKNVEYFITLRHERQDVVASAELPDLMLGTFDDERRGLSAKRRYDVLNPTLHRSILPQLHTIWKPGYFCS